MKKTAALILLASASLACAGDYDRRKLEDARHSIGRMYDDVTNQMSTLDGRDPNFWGKLSDLEIQAVDIREAQDSIDDVLD